MQAGYFDQANRSLRLDAGPAFTRAEEVAATPVQGQDGKLVYLRDVARVEDATVELESYTRIGFGQAAAESKTVRTGNSTAADEDPAPSAQPRVG
jgi:multidrug efflux pump subunit AcrB